MMKFRILVYSALILLASVNVLTPVRGDETDHFRLIDAYWGTDQPVEVAPGDVATLTVVIRYEKGWTFSNLKAVLSLPDGFEAVGDGRKVAVQYSGPISIGSLINLGFPVFITSDVEKGDYQAHLKVEYYISKYVIPKEELQINFEITGRPEITVKAPNTSLYEGKQQISIALSNEGDAVGHSVEVMKVYSSVVSVELEDDRFLGTFDPGDNTAVPLSIHVPLGMKGQIIPLTIEVSYFGPSNVGYLFSMTLQLPVKPSEPIPSLRLSLLPRELIIGKSSKVYVDLANTGNHDLSDIKLTLSPDNVLKIFGPTVSYVSKIGPEEKRRIETEIYVPSTISAPTATLTATVTYFDGDVWALQSESYQLSMLLRGFIEISLTDEAVIPSTPRIGGPFSITMTVTNIGTSTAYAAYAIPDLEDLPLKTFGPKSVYIGNIELNLPTTFTVNLQLENTTESRITLPVTLRYMDNLRSLHNVTFSVPIDVAPQTGSSSQTSQPGRHFLGDPLTTVGITAAVAVTAVIIVIAVKRRR